MNNKLYRKIVPVILSLSIGVLAFGKERSIQPWQKESIQLPVISTTVKKTANPAQLRLLTKYYAIEQAYTEFNTFILALPIDSTRTIQSIIEKRPQLIATIDKSVRNKSMITGFEYSSDSSAQITITIEPKVIVDIIGPYMKPEKPPKPVKSEKPKKADKPKSKKVKKEKDTKESETKSNDSQKSNTPTSATPAKTDVKKEEQPPKDSATP